jgi:hypothetical protein
MYVRYSVPTNYPTHSTNMAHAVLTVGPQRARRNPSLTQAHGQPRAEHALLPRCAPLAGPTRHIGNGTMSAAAATLLDKSPRTAPSMDDAPQAGHRQPCYG